MIRLLTEAVTADGPATPDGGEWYYWGESRYRTPGRILHENRFPPDGPRPALARYEDFPDHETYRRS